MSESVSLVIACSRSSDTGVQHKIRKQEKNKKEKREREFPVLTGVNQATVAPPTVY